MYDLEREQKIIELLQHDGAISVDKLSSSLFVSTSTIRRDLAKMERKGLVRRTFGGALLNASPSGEETAFPLRKKENLNIKRSLCQKASDYIEGNSTIFIDSSSTCLLLVPYLNNYKNLTIITNGLFLANEVISKTEHQVILPGGSIQPKTNSIVGTETYRFIESLHCDRFFFSCSGIDLEYGITESSKEQSQIKQSMLSHSSLAICLVDQTKFGHISLWKTCPVKDIDVLISDHRLNEKEKGSLGETTFIQA